MGCHCYYTAFVLSVAPLIVLIANEVKSQAQEGDIRLVGGTSPGTGRVEIYHSDTWGTICDDGWSYYDSIVTCRQLGFTGSSTAKCCAYYGSGSDPIWLSSMACTSTEDLLVECGNRGWGSHNCGHYEDAGVICNEPTNAVRLQGGQGELEGRVEVFVNGRWGSVCADDWDITDANVVCKQLKFTEAVEVYNGTYFQQVSTDTSMVPVVGNLACSGSEEYLAACSHSGWGYIEDCQQGTAGVQCRIDFGADKIRLVGGSSNAGRVEVFFDDEWGTICDDHWDINDGAVACRQLGFPGVLNVTTGSSYGQGSGAIWLDDMACNGNELHLAECRHDGWGVIGRCTHAEDAGVICLLTHDGDVRLVGGADSSEGRVEIFHDKEWGSICDNGWDENDASVTCRHLGFKNFESLREAGAFGVGSGTIWLSNVSCNGNETFLSECEHANWGETNRCTHNNDVGIVCSEASNRLRLVGGQSNLEGRVEIYHNGRWGTVCPDNWDADDVKVVCRYLGFSGEGSVMNNFGKGSGPIWLGDLNCTGREGNLAECEHTGWERNDCNFAYQAGLMCFVAREGDVRLVNNVVFATATVLEGRVEVYHKGAWGTVCGRGWDIHDGKVVCRQLGFTKVMAIEPDSEFYGPGGGEVLLVDIDCSGSESSLIRCDFSGWGTNDCNHTQDVGVICSHFDETPPVVYNCPQDINITVEVGSRSDPVFWMEPWAADDTGITTLLTNSHDPGYSFPAGSTSVTYLFINPANNIAACTFKVNGISVDTTPPMILQCPNDIFFPVSNGTVSVPVSWTEPSAFDLSNATLLSNTASTGAEFSLGSTPIVYNFVDAFGNQAYCNFTVNVFYGGSTQTNIPTTSSNQSDIINCPNDTVVDVELGTQGKIIFWQDPWVNSQSGNVTVLLQTHTTGSIFSVGRTTVTYIFMDAFRQLITCHFTVIGRTVDTAPPDIYQCPHDIQKMVQYGTISASIVSWLEPFAIDISNNVSITKSHWPGMAFPLGVTPVTYTFIDGSDNRNDCVFNVTLSQDTQPVTTPELNVSNCPADINMDVEVGTWGSYVTWTEPVVASQSGVVTLVSKSHVPGDLFSVGRTTVEYIFADETGQVANCVFNVVGKMVDTTPPEIHLCTGNKTVKLELGMNSTMVMWTEPFATDASGISTTTKSHSPGANFVPGMTLVLYRFIDGVGNNSTCEFYVDVNLVDTTPPEVTGCPRRVSTPKEVGEPLPQVSWNAPSANDLSGTPLVSSTHEPGATFNVGTTMVVYMFEDNSGNVATCEIEVTVEEVDTRAPTINDCPSDIRRTVELGTAGTSVSWEEPSAVDASGVPNLVLRSHKLGSNFANGTNTVTYLYADLAGNIGSCVFTVSIRTVDTTPPLISQCPTDIITSAPRDGKVIWWTRPTAVDLSGTATRTASDFGGPGTGFPIGFSTIHYYFTDTSGNTANCSFDIIIKGLPTLENCPTNIRRTVELGESNIPVTWAEPSVNADVTTERTTLLFKSHSPGAYFPTGRTEVSYVFVDYSSNAVSCKFAVIISTEDTSPPNILQCPSDIERIATSHSAGTAVTWTEPYAIDPSSFTQSQSHSPGSVFQIGTTRVTYTFTDNNGNQATCTFSITIDPVDTIFFEVSNCPDDIADTVELGTNSKTVTWEEPSAFDPHGVVTLDFQSHQSGDKFNVGESKVIYEFTNQAGHAINCSFKVIITSVDTTPPVINGCPRDQHTTMEIGPGGKSVAWDEPTASDVSGQVNLITKTHVPNSLFYPGLTAVTYIYADPSNNLATCAFKVNTIAIDTSPPLVTSCPSNIVETVKAGTSSVVVTWTEPEAIDMSGNMIAKSGSRIPGDSFPVGTTTVTYQFWDHAQNLEICVFNVTIVEDINSEPEIRYCPEDINATTTNQLCQTTWNEPQPADISRNTVLLLRTHAPGGLIPIGNTIVTYIFKDKRTNFATCSFTITCSLAQSAKQTQRVEDTLQLTLSIASLIVAGTVAVFVLLWILLLCLRRRERDIKHFGLDEDFDPVNDTNGAPRQNPTFHSEDNGLNIKMEEDTNI